MSNFNEREFFEENIYKTEYIDSLVDDDAISPDEAAFLQGYNT